MTQEKTLTQSNRLIAEFMGLEEMLDERFYPETTQMYFRDGWVKESDLKYHTSWDWLMPVIEKISRIPLPYKQDDGRQDTHWPRTFGMLDEWENPMFRFNCGKLFTADTLIEAAYAAVVDFIEWYNQNKVKP